MVAVTKTHPFSKVALAGNGAARVTEWLMWQYAVQSGWYEEETLQSEDAESEDARAKPSLTDSLLNMPLPMAMSLMGYCGPALADEAVDAANQSSGFLGFTNAGTLIAFSPIVVYSVFYVYRATVNPKAKLQDLLFIAAACVVVANIASIVIFKKRIY